MTPSRRRSSTPCSASDDEDEAALGTAAALESAKGLIRSEVAKQLGMRHAPTLEFVADALPENARHLDEVLAKARAHDEAVAARARRGVRRRARTRTRSPARRPTRPTSTSLDDDERERRRPGWSSSTSRPG